MILFSSNSIVSSNEVRVLQKLRSIVFPLRFIPLDDHKLGVFGIFLELLRSVVVLLSTLKIRTA